MHEQVRLIESGQQGPRVLLLPGLGARGSGFRALAGLLSSVARPVIVDYPEGAHAGVGARSLALQVAAAAGTFDAAIVSSFGGMVGAHLAAMGTVRGVAFLGSFAKLDQLGIRGPLIRLMGPIAELGRPGQLAAIIAANGFVPATDVEHVVPTTFAERRGVTHRALAIPREPSPPSLRDLPLSCIALHGERDWLVPRSVLSRLAASLPDGTPTHVLPGAGHVPYFSHPAECAELLLPWLRALEAKATPAQTAA